MDAFPDLEVRSAYWRSLAVVLLFTAAVHLPLLLVNSALWDSLVVLNAQQKNDPEVWRVVFGMHGSPDTGLMHETIGKLPSPAVAYKYLSFLCILTIAGSTFALARQMRLIGNREATFIAALTISFPFFSLWQEPIMIAAIHRFAVFLVAAMLYTHAEKAPRGWRRVLTKVFAWILFIESFAHASLAVLFYPFLLYVYLSTAVEFNRRTAGRFLLHKWVAILVPVLAVFGRRMLWPPHGVYSDYNKVSIGGYTFFKWLVVTPKRIVLDSLRDYLQFAWEGKLEFACYSLVACAIVVALLTCLRRDDRSSISVRQLACILGYSLVLFYACTFAYSMANKFPLINSFASRHALLAALPIGIASFGIVRLLAPNRIIETGFLAIILIGFVTVQERNYILWQNRSVLKMAIEEGLRREGAVKPGIVLLNDQSGIGMSVPFSTYGVNWMLKQAFHSERYWGSDQQMFLDTPLARHHELSSAVKRGAYMYSDYVPTKDGTLITIRQARPRTDLAIYWQYLCSGAGEKEFLQSLLKLDYQPIQVDWPSGKNGIMSILSSE